MPGYTGLLVPWMGGASSPAAPPTQAGVVSMLAFWMGGAALPGSIPVPPTPPPFPRGYAWPFRCTCDDDDDECCEKVIDCLEPGDADRVEECIEKCVAAVVEDKPRLIVNHERVFQSVVQNVSRAIRSDITEIIRERKLRKQRIRDLFVAEVEHRIALRNLVESERIEAARQHQERVDAEDMQIISYFFNYE